VETVCWALAWSLPQVWWAGRKWQVTPHGKLRRKEPERPKKYLSSP
jgi:hypothetical protein